LKLDWHIDEFRSISAERIISTRITSAIMDIRTRNNFL